MQDFIAGCFGGAAQLVVGHPFDTIKVETTGLDEYRPNDLVRLVVACEMPMPVLFAGQVAKPAETAAGPGPTVCRSF